MAKINAEYLAQIKGRAEGSSFTSAYVKGDPWKGYEVKNVDNGIVIAETSTEADAQFLSHARQDVPALIAEVERLTRITETIRDNTFCESTWDFVSRALLGEEMSTLSYKISGEEDEE